MLASSMQATRPDALGIQLPPWWLEPTIVRSILRSGGAERAVLLRAKPSRRGRVEHLPSAPRGAPPEMGYASRDDLQ
jgi:hypothetical protein